MSKATGESSSEDSSIEEIQVITNSDSSSTAQNQSKRISNFSRNSSDLLESKKNNHNQNSTISNSKSTASSSNFQQNSKKSLDYNKGNNLNGHTSSSISNYYYFNFLTIRAKNSTDNLCSPRSIVEIFFII